MTDKKFIDLGEDYGDMCSPSSGKKMYYPSISLEDEEIPSGLKVGDEGTAAIKFKVTRRSESEDDNEKGEHKSLSLDILSVAFDGSKDPASKKTNDDQEAIKRGLDEADEDDE